jgi:hypothetical protein
MASKTPHCILHKVLIPMNPSGLATLTLGVVDSVHGWACPDPRCYGFYDEGVGYSRRKLGNRPDQVLPATVTIETRCGDHQLPMLASHERDGVVTFVCPKLDCQSASTILRSAVDGGPSSGSGNKPAAAKGE